MRVDLPVECLGEGFVNEPVGTHTSRTIMLRELRALLGATHPSATYVDYREAAVDENAVHKRTLATRSKTFRHLRELYSLSRDVAAFRGLRVLWDSDIGEQSMLAALCAAAREPMLRSTLDEVLELEIGEPMDTQALSAALSDAFPGHYSPGVAARAGRNLASSWQQAGLLTGKVRKVRAHPCTGSASVAYALWLGHLCGARGDLLLHTPWTRMLDLPEQEVRALATVASRRGWLEYRESGGATEITFRHFDEPKDQVSA